MILMVSILLAPLIVKSILTVPPCGGTTSGRRLTEIMDMYTVSSEFDTVASNVCVSRQRLSLYIREAFD